MACGNIIRGKTDERQSRKNDPRRNGGAGYKGNHKPPYSAMDIDEADEYRLFTIIISDVL
jgi:hypothetical protein